MVRPSSCTRWGSSPQRPDDRPVRAFLRDLAPARELGYDLPSEPLVADELLALEPALSPQARSGLYLADHWHVSSSELAVALADLLRRDGVAIEEGIEVSDIVIEGSQARAVRTPIGTVGADAVVIAAGAWSVRIAKAVGMQLPIVAGKGYSFLVRPRRVPTHAVMLLEPHVGCSPFGDLMRVAGTMEFSGLDSPINSRRVDSIKRLARPLLDWHEGSETEPWAGLRPVAPDGLPVVGRLAKFENVFVASGYSNARYDARPTRGRRARSLDRVQHTIRGADTFRPRTLRARCDHTTPDGRIADEMSGP